MQKPKERTTPLSHASTTYQRHADNLHGRASNQHQPDKFSPESEMELDQKTLMAALHTYITQNLSAQSNDKSSHSRTKGSQIYADKFYSSQVSPFDGTFAKGKAEDLKMKKLIQPRPASRVLGPTPEMLNHRSASMDNPKDPLSIVDGKVDILFFLTYLKFPLCLLRIFEGRKKKVKLDILIDLLLLGYLYLP